MIAKTLALKLLTFTSLEDHPGALNRPTTNVPTTTRIQAPKPYTPPSHNRPPQTITVQSGAPPAPGHRQPAKPFNATPPAPKPTPHVPQPKATPSPNKGPRTPCCDTCGEVIQ